jgi:hypothetical protein
MVRLAVVQNGEGLAVVVRVAYERRGRVGPFVVLGTRPGPERGGPELGIGRYRPGSGPGRRVPCRRRDHYMVRLAVVQNGEGVVPA